MEVINRKAVAYPNRDQHLNTAAPSTHFLSGQSVYVDSSDTLGCWTWAPRARHAAHLRRSQARGLDLTTNAVKRTIGSRQSDHDGHFDQRRAL